MAMTPPEEFRAREKGALGEASDEFEAEPIPTRAREAPSAQPAQSAAGVARPAETRATPMRQVLDVLSHPLDRTVEVALRPDEMGKVKLVFASSEAGLHVTVSADRPETLDLMRRQIDQLHQELRAAGYDRIRTDFSGPSDRRSGSADSGKGPDGRSERGEDYATDSATPVPPAAGAVSGGLDLRL